MRIRVKLDVRKSLKRGEVIRKPSKELKVTFKYERLPTFCFICGRISHIDRYYEVRFRVPEDQIVKLRDNTLKDSPRRHVEEPMSRWLHPSPNEGVKQTPDTYRTPLAVISQRHPTNIRTLRKSSSLLGIL
ncbi:hypothetical protein LINPERHAP1_LOCUS18918 [Linum perenne]